MRHFGHVRDHATRGFLRRRSSRFIVGPSVCPAEHERGTGWRTPARSTAGTRGAGARRVGRAAGHACGTPGTRTTTAPRPIPAGWSATSRCRPAVRRAAPRARRTGIRCRHGLRLSARPAGRTLASTRRRDCRRAHAHRCAHPSTTTGRRNRTATPGRPTPRCLSSPRPRVQETIGFDNTHQHECRRSESIRIKWVSARRPARGSPKSIAF